jgi:O-antigen/teichoic acid export membrane protein
VSTKILKNASSLLLVQILNPLLGMAFVVMLARINGAASLGVYTFAIAMVAIFENVAGLGIREYIIRELGKNPAQWRALHNCAMAVGVVASLLAQIAMLIFSRLMGYDAETVHGLFIISFSLLPSVILYLSVSFLYAFDRMAIASATFFVETLARTILGLVIIFLDLGMSWLLASFALSRIIAATMSWCAQAKHPGMPGRVWERGVFRNLLKAVPTFAAMAILAAVYWRLNVIMLSRLCDAEAVGYYGAGYRLMDLISFVGSSILTATYPTMTRLFHHVRQDFKLLLDKGMQYTIVGYLPVVVAVHVMSPKIIALFFGEKFTAAAEALRILTWVTFPLTLAKLFANSLVIAGRQDLDLRVNLYRLIWNAVLSYVLIVKMGMIGACWAMLLSIIASVILQIYYLRDIVRPTLSLSQIVKPGIAVISMLFGLKLTMTWPLLPQALLATGIYLTAFLALKPFDMEDRRLLHCLGQARQQA